MNPHFKKHLGISFMAMLVVFFGTERELAAKDGYSNNSGTLTSYEAPTLVDGTGKKLLAIYMVGSDLETSSDLATADLNELISGYNSLGDTSNIDVIVAFGGANKTGWAGMKFAAMAQIIQDAADKSFGNETGSGAYLYRADGAHMGDKSSLELFLKYLKDGYGNHEQKFLALWDHGASYGGFGNDENFNYDLLTLDEIDNAMTDSGIGKLNLIGFDACLMGSIEVARYVNSHADYLLASEELEPGHGWYWAEVIKNYAQQSTAVDAAKAIADNFVLDVHEYRSDGKTLSVVDLSKYDTLVTKIDAFATDYSQKIDSNEEYKQSIIYAVTNVRDYGKQVQEDKSSSVDLKDLAEKLKSKNSDTTASQILDDLISAVDGYVVYSKQDSSRPNSNGVSIAPVDYDASRVSQYMLNSNWIALQQAYAQLKAGDTTAPTVQNEDSSTHSNDFEWDSSVVSDVCVDQQSQREKAVERSVTAPPFLQGERAAFITSISAHKDISGTTTLTAQGVSATFSDENLAKVITIFGFELDAYENRPNDIYYMTVGALEAYPTTTTGQYFTPKWNKKWYSVAYDPGAEMTEWMPMMFEGRYCKDGITNTIYYAEIDYIEAGKDYSDYDYPVDLAVLRIIVDDNNQVLNHLVQTYKILYSDDNDTVGHVQYDKATKQLQSGDKIQFFTYGFHLTDSSQDEWFATSDVITFTQEAKFDVEELAFVDEDNNLLVYKYAMWAEDASGNGKLTTPAMAETSSSDGSTSIDDTGNTGETANSSNGSGLDSNCFIGSTVTSWRGLIPLITISCFLLLIGAVRQSKYHR